MPSRWVYPTVHRFRTRLPESRQVSVTDCARRLPDDRPVHGSPYRHRVAQWRQRKTAPVVRVASRNRGRCRFHHPRGNGLPHRDGHWLSDLVLIEADGSKRLPCKVPADHEPVLLPESDIVVAVLGLSALGRSLKECCFRLEKAKKLLSADENHLLTEKDMAAILLSNQGLRKDVGDRRYIAVLNQCDDRIVRESAEQVRKMLINSTGQNSETIEKIVFAKLQ